MAYGWRLRLGRLGSDESRTYEIDFSGPVSLEQVRGILAIATRGQVVWDGKIYTDAGHNRHVGF
jgi:hypothetical protein